MGNEPRQSIDTSVLPGMQPDKPIEESASARIKRACDLVIVLLTLPIALPVILVLAFLIRIESPGNPIFRQTRVGRAGRPFTMFKLRTMVANAEHMGAGIYASVDDDRFTKVGILARRSSLDELPQLINVLRGEMSIVGPRPMLPMIVAQYADEYAVILQAKPGITGLAQVSGRNTLPRHQRLALDKEYVRTANTALDLQILARTIVVALTGAGQLNTQSRSDVEG